MWGLLAKLVLGLALSYIAYLLTPKPPPPDPAKLSEFDIPKANEGDRIPKLFGTVTIYDPQVAWYGDLKTEAIKSRTGKK